MFQTQCIREKRKTLRNHKELTSSSHCQTYTPFNFACSIGFKPVRSIIYRINMTVRIFPVTLWYVVFMLLYYLKIFLIKIVNSQMKFHSKKTFYEISFSHNFIYWFSDNLQLMKQNFKTLKKYTVHNYHVGECGISWWK